MPSPRRTDRGYSCIPHGGQCIRTRFPPRTTCGSQRSARAPAPACRFDTTYRKDFRTLCTRQSLRTWRPMWEHRLRGFWQAPIRPSTQATKQSRTKGCLDSVKIDSLGPFSLTDSELGRALSPWRFTPKATYTALFLTTPSCRDFTHRVGRKVIKGIHFMADACQRHILPTASVMAEMSWAYTSTAHRVLPDALDNSSRVVSPRAGKLLDASIKPFGAHVQPGGHQHAAQGGPDGAPAPGAGDPRGTSAPVFDVTNAGAIAGSTALRFMKIIAQHGSVGLPVGRVRRTFRETASPAYVCHMSSGWIFTHS